jgi:predicted Zn finger-like uncharacterized protein
MILTCPECSTRYQAKDSAFLPSGRRVRCVKCGHNWFQEPPPAEPDEDVLAPPVPEPVPEPVSETEPASEPEPEPALRAAYAPPGPDAAPEPGEKIDVGDAPAGRPRAARLALVGGWAGLVLAVLVIGWAAVSFRAQVATLWPQSASLYSALGIKVNARGLAIADVKYQRDRQDGQPVFVVTGKLVNVSGHEIAVPPVRIILSAADGHELYHWDFTPSVSTLQTGKSTNFQTRLSSPPSGVRKLTVQLADAKE